MMTKKKLNVINGSQQITCYDAHAKHNVSCNRKNCEQWINHSESKNCSIIATQNGGLTLQEVGQIFGLTRMRICQIEKNIYSKLKKAID